MKTPAETGAIAWLANAFANLFCQTKKAFRLIAAIQFSAPWNRRSRDVGCA